MSFLTCFWLFPQKEHFSRSPPSPMRATWVLSSFLADRSAGDQVPTTRMTAVPPTLPRGTHERVDHRGRVGGFDAGSADSGRLAVADHLVDEAVLERLGGGQDLVALDV